MTVDEYKRLGKNRNKYHNQKVALPGIGTFDSKKEYDRWGELRALELIGMISGLRRQVRYEVIPEQRDAGGRLLEPASRYVADFVYTENGETVVEDTKGYRTAEYILKRKLMLLVHGMRIRET